MSGHKTWVEGGDEASTAPDPHYTETGVVLGSGGLGRVDLVVDDALGREVARKRLLADAPAHRARLLREARTTASLEHPGIVAVHALGEDEQGRPFYTMRRVRGRSLADVLASVRTAAERRALVSRVLDVAQALAYAHAQGVVHRDLNPANVMVDRYGETVVVDWGLAARVGDPAEPGFRGTLGYTSPEQARGEPPDPRADVWSLGAVLWEVLAGPPPVVERDAALAALRQGRPPPSAPLPAAAPRDLASVARKALEAAPDRRYPDAGAFAQELERWTAGEPVEAHRYSLRERLAKSVARSPRTWAGGGAAGTVALLVTAAVAATAWVQRNEALRAEALSAVAVARTEADAGEFEQAGLDLARAREVLVSLGDDPAPADLGAAWLRYRRGATFAVLPGDATTENLALSASGARLARADDERVQVVALPSGRTLLARTFAAGDEVGVPAFDGEVAYVRVAHGARQALVAVETGAEVAVVTSPDEVWFRIREGRVWVTDPVGGTRRLGPGGEVLAAVPEALQVLDADVGGRILVGYTSPAPLRPEEVVVWDGDTGARRLTLPADTSPTVSPDGAWVAAADERGITVAATDGSVRWRRELPHPSAVLFRGSSVLVVTRDARARWYRARDGEPDSESRPCSPLLAAVSADGRRAVVRGADGLRVHLLPAPGEGLGPSEVGLVTPLPGGLVALGDATGRVRLVDPRSGLALEEVPVATGTLRTLAWDGGGRLLVVPRGPWVEVRDLAREGLPVLARHEGSGPAATAGAWADEGGAVLVSWQDGRIEELDGRTLDARGEAAVDVFPWDLAPLPGGRVLVTGRRPTDRRWVVVDRATRSVVAESDDRGSTFDVDVSADRGSAWISEGVPEVLRLGLPELTRLALPTSGVATELEVDAESRRVAVLTLDGWLELRDVDGRRLGRFPLQVEGGARGFALRDDEVVSVDYAGTIASFDLGPVPSDAEERLRACFAAGDGAAALELLDAGPEADALDRVRAHLLLGDRAAAAAALEPIADGLDPVARAAWRSAVRR